jgi:hypothetical protein
MARGGWAGLEMAVGLALLLASGPPADARARSEALRSANPKIEVKVSGESQAFQWLEYDEDGGELLEESGLRHGIVGSMELLTWPIGVRVDLRAGQGTVDYDGQTWGGTPFETEVDYEYGGLGVYAMGRIPFGRTSSSGVRIVTGVDFDAWTRDPQPNGNVIVYVEEWYAIAGRFGAGVDVGLGGPARIVCEVGAKLPIYTVNDVADWGSTVDPEGTPTPYLSVHLEIAHVHVALRHEVWHWDQSDPGLADIGGNDVWVRQPESEANITAVQLGACWRW